MAHGDSEFCFCTLAFSPTYRALAQQLAGDIEKHCPDIPFIIFTDKPSDFKQYKNALVFKHKQQGVLYYHERRFAIAKALSMFNSCMYLDADVRLCAPIPNNIQWQPGITARSCTTMMKHVQERLYNKNQKPRPDVMRTFEFAQRMAQKLGLDIEGDRVMFINEFLFVVSRDNGRELEFLDLWGKLALYAEINGHHKHPAYAMGLAAAKLGFPVRYDAMEGVDFFDDRIEKVRIAKGEADAEAKKEYFETQKKLENPKRSPFTKVLNKVIKSVTYSYHALRLKVETFTSDFDFYYR